MKSNLTNKVCVVTGASSGIGLATAIALLQQGAKVVLAARRLNEMQLALAEFNFPIENMLFLKTDVSVEEDCKNLIEQAIKQFGKVDVLVNNAGISMRAMFDELDIAVLKKLMDVNFWGTVYCTKYALPSITENKGSIVGVSSIAGFKGLPARTGYSASKFAMHGFLETLRIELLKKEVHVMIICPGYTASNIRKTALNAGGNQQGESPLTEQNLMQPEVVAAHLVNGIINRKRTVILTLQGKLTVFINKFFPAFIDKMVYTVIAKEPDSPFK